MREHEGNEADDGAADELRRPPGLELQTLALIDTVFALASLARIELGRSLSTLPRLALLNLLRLPLWLLFWLSLCAWVSYGAYVASGGSVGLALSALLLMQGGLCLGLELRLRVLGRRVGFAQTRQALRECQETWNAARAADKPTQAANIQASTTTVSTTKASTTTESDHERH
ncbi:MAG: hypothetical protein LBF16_15160 [Pseudomonadales bacterium]|jgi:hypothetical protein|nr:hypothetical protein [Pseudomonadales bacterium]